MITNIHDVGFLPGGESLKYGPHRRIVVMKNRENNPLADEWFRRTRKTMAELSRLNYAFLVDHNPNGYYQVDFIKCRDRGSILKWCREQWGESAHDGRWYLIPRESYNPRMLVRNEEDLVLFRMTWE